MTLVPDDVRLEDDVVRPRLHCNGIIAIVDDTIRYSDIGGRDVEAIGVEREGSRRLSVNDSMAHIDVVSFQLHIPCNGLARLEIGQRAVVSLKAHEMWTGVYA